MALCTTCGGDKQTSCISGVSSKDDQLLETSVVVHGSFRKDDLLLTVSPAVSRTLGVIQSSFVREGKNSSEAKLQRCYLLGLIGNLALVQLLVGGSSVPSEVVLIWNPWPRGSWTWGTSQLS
jgi:hypothetical protein